MKARTKSCRICKRSYRSHPRNAKKNQTWGQKTCGRRECRLAWQRKYWLRWMKLNPGYRKSTDWRRKVCAWAKAHPDYWRQYRSKHPGYVSQDNQRRSLARRKSKVSAKQRAIPEIVVEKLHTLQNLEPSDVSAKQRPILRRVDAIEDCLRSTVEALWSAKPRPIDRMGLPAG